MTDAFQSLLPKSASDFERAIEQVIFEELQAINPNLSTLWHIDNCPESYLPHLAAAFSVDRWKSSWSSAIKRQVIRNAFKVHQHKGTPAAVMQALSSFGIVGALSEWFADGSANGTFKLDFLESDQSSVDIFEPETQTELIDVVDQAKRFSQKMSITVGTQVPINHRLGAIALEIASENAQLENFTHSTNPNQHQIALVAQDESIEEATYG